MPAILIFLALVLVSIISRADDAPPGSSDTSRQQKIDDYIAQEIATQRIPGLSLAVVREGKLAFAKGYGKASLELNVPSGPETLYGLGSISKQFTSAAIMLLVQDHKIELSDTLEKYFSWTPKEWKAVTIRHLLTHTSGIRQEKWTGGIAEFDRFEHDQETVVRTAFGPVESKPGEKWSYSNIGYRLLGMIIEKASGQTYWNFLSDRIFRPLGMNATRNSDPATVIPNRARGYALVNGQLINREPVTATAAFSEGALISSVLDLVKWDDALRSDRILTMESLDQIWSPVILNNGSTHPYGLGWFVCLIPNHKTVAHAGGLPGFTSFIWRFIDDQLTVILLANNEDADIARISLHVAGFYCPVAAAREVENNCSLTFGSNSPPQ